MIDVVILQFDELFWPNDTEYFGVADGEDDSFLTYWLNYYYYVGRPVLKSYSYGTDAWKAESYTDDELKEIGRGI